MYKISLSCLKKDKYGSISTYDKFHILLQPVLYHHICFSNFSLVMQNVEMKDVLEGLIQKFSIFLLCLHIMKKGFLKSCKAQYNHNFNLQGTYAFMRISHQQ